MLSSWFWVWICDTGRASQIGKTLPLRAGSGYEDVMNRIRLVFLALIFTACAAVCADEPKKDAPKGKESVRLDTKTLGEMLVDMGLETKLVDDIFHKIRWSIKDSEFPLWLSISTDKR